MKPVFFLLLLPFLFTACDGQNKTSSPGNHLTTPGFINTGQPKIVKTQGTNEFATICSGIMDKKGQLWFGTAGEGIYCYDGKTFLNYTTKQGLCNNTVYAICQDKTGKLWFGTNGGVCYYDGTAFTDFSAQLGLGKI